MRDLSDAWVIVSIKAASLHFLVDMLDLVLSHCNTRVRQNGR
jgi:hypothetical protein